jgi:putative tricarboxylic transport membrane protein
MLGIETLLQPIVILSALLGVALGIIWGAMPGLSTTMAMALLVGLTYKFQLPVAITFLLGTFTGSVFGGAITAVLINIPGTPDNVPTQIAGFPLTKKGRGGLALGTAIVASFFGGWFGIVVLVALVPLIMPFALRFGAWEMFWLALWGIVISGRITGGQRPIKGWIAGWLGLLVSTVGIEPIHGYERFSFGSAELAAGLSFVPIMIGLFGLTEVIKVLVARSPDIIPQKVGRIVPPFHIIKKYWKDAIRSGAIGTILGVIPGAGAGSSTFISYKVAEDLSGEDFSKGSLHGVLAAEVADNANIGGQLIPTLTLAIPGSTPAAAFMAALSLHGVVVGPMIQQEHPGLLYFVYGALIIANILMYGLALLLIRPSVKLFSLPRELLMPFIVVLCVLGAYCVNISQFDLSVMFISGLLGFLLYKMGYPFAPAVLAVILGPLADENLRKAMLIFQHKSIWDVLSRPIGTILMILVLLTILEGLIRRR